MDYSTRLPPRKRLLAGTKAVQNCASSPDDDPTDNPVVLPSRFNSADLRARVQAVLDRSYSAEEFVEASSSLALAAERIAAVARAEALEKAEIAAKVKAFAKSVLEAAAAASLASKGQGGGCARGKKKRVAVGQLYGKPDRSHVEDDDDDDEEVVRRLHHVMNSSPRRRRRRAGRKHGCAVAKTKDLNCEVVVKGDEDTKRSRAGSSSSKENKGSSLKLKKKSALLLEDGGDGGDTEKNGLNSHTVEMGKKKHGCTVVRTKDLNWEVVKGNGDGKRRSCVGSLGKENKGSSVKLKRSSSSSPSLREEGGDHSDTEKNGSSSRIIEAGKKGRVKKKRVLLSRFCGGGSDDPGVAEANQVAHLLSTEGEGRNGAANLTSVLDKNPSSASHISDRNESLWKRKKLKLSGLYLGEKILAAPIQLKQGVGL